jgi:hypothetical protein
MSSDQDQARLLAERIARRMSQDSAPPPTQAAPAESRTDVSRELSVMRAGLEELQQRLARIESHVTHAVDDPTSGGRVAEGLKQGSAQQPQARRPAAAAAPGTMRSPWLSGMYVPAAAHPSQERFGIEEAAVSELVDFFEGEKKCELEPGGKPCDHCEMCSTRGF